MIKAIIIDDERLARNELKKLLMDYPEIEVVAEAANAGEGIEKIEHINPDLIFLDILMPHITGTDFVRSLRNIPKVIFTTAYKEYALEGFELDVVDYLLKPIRFDRFLRAVSKAFPQKKEELEDNTTSVVVQEKKISSGFIYLKSERKMTKVILDDILYIESAGDYLKVYTQYSTLVTRQTISSIEAILSGDEFIRIHRSYIVSIKKIAAFTHETVTIGKIELPIGKFYLNSFLKLQVS